MELRGGTYMQVYADGHGFCLEHQIVTTGAYYRCASALGSEDAADTLVSYAFGRYDWAHEGLGAHEPLEVAPLGQRR